MSVLALISLSNPSLTSKVEVVKNKSVLLDVFLVSALRESLLEFRSLCFEGSLSWSLTGCRIFFVEGRVTNILDSSMGTNILLPPFEIILTHSKTFYVTKDLRIYRCRNFNYLDLLIIFQVCMNCNLVIQWKCNGLPKHWNEKHTNAL